MRIAPISTVSAPRMLQKRVNKTVHTSEIPQPQNDNVNFKGNAGKIIGAIVGTAACIVFAPAVAAVGLAGIGTMAGLVAGEVVDEKIEENEEDKKKKDKQRP